MSDPIPRGAAPTQEEWATDIHWVLEAVESKRTALFAAGEGGGIVPFYAATHPERVSAMVLLNCFASLARHDDSPAGFPKSVLARFQEAYLSQYGTGANLRVIAPEVLSDERFCDWFARLERGSMSRASLLASSDQLWQWDARHVLPIVRVPTLVIAHEDSAWISPAHSRYLAEHIPSARLIERPGFWGLFWLHDSHWVLDEVERFVTGTRGAPSLDDRVLATVLFTDIVGFTKRAAEIGDQRWHWLLDEHDAIMRGEIDRHRGRPVKSTGDGFLATFDGPARAIRCALAISEAVAGIGLEVRTGLHTGEVEVRGEDVGGIAVHIAARVMAQARPSEVLVSSAVPPLVTGSGIDFVDRGEWPLKGVPGRWQLLAVNTAGS